MLNLVEPFQGSDPPFRDRQLSFPGLILKQQCPESHEQQGDGRQGAQALQALSFTTSFSIGGVIAVEHGLEFGPAAPEDKPAGAVVALAILMPAQSR